MDSVKEPTGVVESESIARLMQAYVDDSVILSEHDKAVYDRLVAADGLVKNPTLPSNERRAKILSKRFGISIRTARNDIRRAADLFNTCDALDVKTGARILISQCDTLYTMCLNAKGKNYFKECTELLKLKKEIYSDLVGLSSIDPNLLKQNTFVFRFGPDAASALQLDQKVSREELIRLLRQYNLTREQETKVLQDVDYLEISDE